MTDERRYGEEEVAEIFELAAQPREAGERPVAPGSGLTLTELQAIGREVGVAPERIAEAASVVALRRSAYPRGRFLGIPISVGRAIDLPRAPTEREWELLVTELRQVFGAQGVTRSSGNLRQWSNGNLYASVEPAEQGYRLRMGTLKGEAVAINRASGALLIGALILSVILAINGELADGVSVPLMLSAMAAAGIAWNALRLPGWALEREKQMEYIAARARALLTDGSADG